MPDENIKTTLQFNADITNFRSAMQEAERAIKLANSEFKMAAAGMDNWSDNTDGLIAKLDQLAAVEVAQQRKLEALQENYRKMAEKQGENSAAAVDLMVRINNQQAAINKTQKEIRDYTDKLYQMEAGADEAAADIKKAGDAAKDAGDSAKESGDGWSILKDNISQFVHDAISSAIDMLANLAESTRDYRREMALMAQNAADSGQDMGVMKEALAGVSAVTGDAEAAMEGLNMLMATGLDTQDLLFATEALTGAAARFDGVNFEGIAEGLQETLATGAAVGPFAEVIERTGENLDTFNKGLAACTDEADKQRYVMDWLANSGLKQVHDSYVQNNADLVAAQEAQFRYNEAMAAVGAAIEPINTAVSNLGATILEKVAPVIQSIVQWTMDNLPVIEPIITGIAAALGVLAAALAIQGIISGVSKAFALLNSTMLANPFVMIAALIAGVVAALVALWQKTDGFGVNWKKVWEGIKDIFAGIVSWLQNAAASIVKYFSDAWQGIKNIWNGAGAFFSGIWNDIQGAFSSVVSTLGNIFSGAWSAITRAFSNVSSFFSGVWNNIKGAFSGALSGMADIGKNIVEGIWNGISNGFTWIKNKISGWVGNVMDFIKNLFGIHSPSKWAEDEVGAMLPAGIAKGITGNLRVVQNASRGLKDAAAAGLSGGVSGGNAGGAAAVGGKTIIFNQTNNSPRQLSRRDIYRQTYNALNYAGGM